MEKPGIFINKMPSTAIPRRLSNKVMRSPCEVGMANKGDGVEDIRKVLVVINEIRMRDKRRRSQGYEESKINFSIHKGNSLFDFFLLPLLSGQLVYLGLLNWEGGTGLGWLQRPFLWVLACCSIWAHSGFLSYSL